MTKSEQEFVWIVLLYARDKALPLRHEKWHGEPDARAEGLDPETRRVLELPQIELVAHLLSTPETLGQERRRALENLCIEAFEEDVTDVDPSSRDESSCDRRRRTLKRWHKHLGKVGASSTLIASVARTWYDSDGSVRLQSLNGTVTLDRRHEFGEWAGSMAGLLLFVGVIAAIVWIQVQLSANRKPMTAEQYYKQADWVGPGPGGGRH